MMKRTFLSLVSMAFIAAMTLTSCDEIMSTIDNPVGSYVQFNDSVLTLLPGQDSLFAATTISPEKVTYKSSDTNVATVDPNGFVTAISYGEAIITASVPANENYQAGSASYKVKVGSEAEKAMKEGAIVAFDLNVDGVDEKVEFKKVGEEFVYQAPAMSAPRRVPAAITTSYSLVYLKAMNAMVFRVIQTNGTETAYPLTVIINLTANTIQVIPGSPLSTVLFVNIKINGVTITGKLTKKEVAPEAVAITGAPSPFVMAVGDADVTLTAVINPADATDKKVTWSSSAPAVATVDQTGKVHAVAVGSTTIKVTTSNGKEASIALTVKDPIVDLSKLTAAYTAKDGETLTGTLAGNYKISIADGATVTLNGVTINGVNDANCTWAGITCEGDATIILKDGTTNTVKGFQKNYPAIFVPGDRDTPSNNKTLTIKGETAGTGELIASGNGNCAGIGGGSNLNAGNIVIQGGIITATGKWGAGIGCGYNGSCGDITITGGTITTSSGPQGQGAGIGAASGYPTPAKCGNITITNGVTKVTATKDTVDEAVNNVGKGSPSSICGTVTIGGTVYWDGSAYKNGGNTYLTTATLVYPAEQ